MKTIQHFALALLCLFITKGVYSANITGLLLGESDNSAIAFASVTVMQNDLLITGSITNDQGRFYMEGVPEGEYTISCSFIGYETKELSLLVGKLNTNYDLGKVYLKALATQLEDVSVVANKANITTQLDKKSFAVEDVLAQAGGSVLDAMKAMPGISVDQEGKVILRGSDKVVVLIDGKQSSLTGYGNQKGLDNLPVANIERIEIINNPSAKYDAAGMAGIINIIYKKEKKDGLNGSVGFAYGLGALSKAKADLPTELGSFSPTPKYIPSLDLNYRKGKWSAFVQSEVLFQEKLPNNEFTTRNYMDSKQTIQSQVPENRKQTHYIIKSGVDYYMDKNNTFTVSGIYDWESHVDSAQVPYINANTGLRNRYIAWNEEEITGYMNYALNYEHKFPETGHTLNANLQYTKGWEDETYYINDSSARRIGRDVTNILATEYTTTFSVDYTKPLRSGRIEGGLKLRVRDLPVDYTVDRGEKSIVYEGMGSWSDWNETIYAAYLNFVHEKKKYDIEAGLRMEYTDVYYKMDDENIYYEQNDSYDYWKLFPNIRLTYKINPKHKVSVFYNRRTDRPSEPELRIFAKSDDHELLKVGNPYLRPQFTQSAEIAYRTIWETGSFYAASYYRYIDNPFMRVYSADERNLDYDVIMKVYANTGSATNKGAEFIFSQSILKFWKLTGNLNLYQNVIHAHEGKLQFPYEHNFSIETTDDTTWDLKVSNQFTISKQLKAQLTAIYYAPKNIPQGKQFARSSVDLGVNYSVLKGKGDITVSFSDIFNDYAIRNELTTSDFTAVYENYYETQVLRLGFKYKF